MMDRLLTAAVVVLEDLFALAGYTHPEGLPDPVPYLRAKYPGITKKALTEAEALFERFDDRYKKSTTRNKGRRS